MLIERFDKTMSETIKLLVVEDEERIRRLLKMYLEREGYEVEEAENGEDALKIALEYDYNCILIRYNDA